jgi:hypothetical protein
MRELFVAQEPKCMTGFAVRELIGPLTILRSWADFVHESEKHGWPSFRDAEVISDRLRVLSDGETVRCVEGRLAFRLRPLPRAPALSAFDSL